MSQEVWRNDGLLGEHWSHCGLLHHWIGCHSTGIPDEDEDNESKPAFRLDSESFYVCSCYMLEIHVCNYEAF